MLLQLLDGDGDGNGVGAMDEDDVGDGDGVGAMDEDDVGDEDGVGATDEDDVGDGDGVMDGEGDGKKTLTPRGLVHSKCDEIGSRMYELVGHFPLSVNVAGHWICVASPKSMPCRQEAIESSTALAFGIEDASMNRVAYGRLGESVTSIRDVNAKVKGVPNELGDWS